MPDRRTDILRDMLADVSETLEELNLSENAMERTDFDMIMPVLARMPNLKVLTCNVNRIWGPSVRAFLDLYLQNSGLNHLRLESLSFRQCDLRDDGVADILARVNLLPHLHSLNVFSNKLTPFVLPHILKFIRDFDRQHFTMDITRRDLNPKEQKDFITKL